MMTIQPNYGGSRDDDFQRIKGACPDVAVLSKEDAYVQMVYDGVWALGMALDDLHARGGDITDGASIVRRLQSVRFDGLTGSIAFDSNTDLAGSYSLREVNNDGLRTVVGKWDEDLRQMILMDAELELRHDSHNTCTEDATLYLLASATTVCLLCCGSWQCKKRQKRKKLSTNTAFLCYTQDGAASRETAVQLHEALEKTLLFHYVSCCNIKSWRKCSRGKVVLPTQDFYGTGKDFASEVRKSRVFILILDWTRSVFEQPWCLLEIYSALSAGVPIVLIELLERNSDGVSREQVQWPDDEQLFRITSHTLDSRLRIVLYRG